MAAAAYRLPAMDMDFLLGDTTRGLRFQLEYQKAEEHLRSWGVATTVVVFGSARIQPDDAQWLVRGGARICPHLLGRGRRQDHRTTCRART